MKHIPAYDSEGLQDIDLISETDSAYIEDLAQRGEGSFLVEIDEAGSALVVQYRNDQISAVPGITSQGAFTPIEDGHGPYPLPSKTVFDLGALKSALAPVVDAATRKMAELTARRRP